MEHPALKLLKPHLPNTKKQQEAEKPVITLDAAGEAEKNHHQFIARRALAAFYSLAELDDDELSEGESLIERLEALIVGIIDADDDGEVSSSEQEDYDFCIESIILHLSELDCKSGDIVKIFESEDALERCLSTAVENLEEGEDAVFDAIDHHVFTATTSKESAYISFDAVVARIRDGKKEIVSIKKKLKKKKLSAKQKAHLKKIQKKPKSAATRRKMSKSMKLHHKLIK